MRGAQYKRDPDCRRDHPRSELLLVQQPCERVSLLASALQQSKKRNHCHSAFYLYQTRQGCACTIGWPTLQANAFPNSGMFDTTPLIRYSSGECSLVMAFARLFSGRSSPQAHCAIPIKKR